MTQFCSWVLPSPSVLWKPFPLPGRHQAPSHPGFADATCPWNTLPWLASSPAQVLLPPNATSLAFLDPRPEYAVCRVLFYVVPSAVSPALPTNIFKLLVERFAPNLSSLLYSKSHQGEDQGDRVHCGSQHRTDPSTR